LQQTRVEQGLPYFRKFIKTYPNVQTLAAAPQDEVLKMWEGLGYYNRARNMHETAQYITNEYDGKFPSSYQELKKLNGIGPYTAAAIASFAFNKPHAVVDGNVYRFLSRLFGIKTPVDTTKGKKQFAERAQSLLDKDKPALHNQAMMEFGAIQCTSRKPACMFCPFQQQCIAFQEGAVHEYPVKAKKQKKTHRYFNYLVIQDPNNHYHLEKRGENDIWRNLYQFPLIETTKLVENKQLKRQQRWKQLFKDTQYRVKGTSEEHKQTLSHQHIHARFWHITLKGKPGKAFERFKRVRIESLKEFAFPKIIVCYIEEKILSLHVN
jgi:A/G-specific adenine glycosylase